jgi:predicted phage terminase large subunit-like protein
MILEPPGHGKTWQISRWFPPWYLGYFPDRKVQLISYSASLAKESCEKARDIFDEYAPGSFGVSLDRYHCSRNNWQVYKHSGGMQSVGMGGTITGYHPDLMILDDVIKDAKTALSAVQREGAWKWFESTPRTRLMPDGAIIATGYLWHQDDLLRRIVAEGEKNGEPWTVLRLPAVADPIRPDTEPDPLGRKPGEPLCPEMWPLSALEKFKGSPYWWCAQFILDPRGEGGTEWPEDYFNHADLWFDEPPPVNKGRTVLALDSSKGVGGNSGDYSAFVYVQWYDGCAYIDADLDNTRAAEMMAQQGVEKLSKRRADYFAIEEEFGGHVLEPLVKRIARDRNLSVPLVRISTEGVHKEIRIRRLGGYLQTHQLRFKSGSPGTQLLVKQLREFPLSEHDDGPDALEMAIRTLEVTQ